MLIEMPVDLNNVEASEGFELLPPDNYRVRIKKIEPKTSEKGSYLNIQYEIVENASYNGRILFGVQSYPTSTDTAEMVEKKASMFKGWLQKFGVASFGAEFTTEDMLGLEAECTVVQSTYQKGDGSQATKNEIKRFL